MSFRRILGALLLVGATFPARADGREELLQNIPARGVRFATIAAAERLPGGGRFVIGEVGPTGLRLLLDESRGDFDILAWLDHATLVAFDGGSESPPFIQVYVDAKPAGAPVPIPLDIWGVPLPEARNLSFDLVVDKKNDIWVATCLVWNDTDFSQRCTKYVGLRFDRTAGGFAEKPSRVPAKAVNARIHGAGIPLKKMPKMKAPPGFTVTLHKTDILDGSAMMGDGRGVPAFTCKGPDGSATWPTADVVNWEFHVRPKTIRWISNNPPLFAVEGRATNPVGESGPARAFFRGCTHQAMEDAAFGPHGVWFESVNEMDGTTVVGAHWIVNVGPFALGQFPASWGAFAVAPE